MAKMPEGGKPNVDSLFQENDNREKSGAGRKVIIGIVLVAVAIGIYLLTR